ncbi:MAG: glycosyltransferase family 9 protein [Verrucomicrobiae bacterium]|nr:glycosyltransferase family 9 protein [Verrucomicrobiae bacterium]
MPTDQVPDSAPAGSRIQRLLLIRNDNIGDLICSIPAIQLCRRKLPHAVIHLLVNSYNAPVVEPLVPRWVDQLIVYRKTKHTGLTFSQMFHLAGFYGRLRLAGYDSAVMLLGGKSRQALSFARWTGACAILGYDIGIPSLAFREGNHEVEYSWRLAANLCGTAEPPPASIDYPLRAAGNRLAVQITSRKPGNRWEASRFAGLGRKLLAQRKEKALLLWSPGPANTPTHPGDDEKAAEIVRLAPEAFEACPTPRLQDLMDTLRSCDTLITPDGGAMHLAAAMGLRLVTLFGQSDPKRWRPWTPRAQVLISPTQNIADIPVEAVLKAWQTVQADKINR